MDTIYGIDAIPETCPCGRGIVAQTLVSLARNKHEHYTCPDCKRQWSLKTGNMIEADAASCGHGAVWRKADGSCAHATCALSKLNNAAPPKARREPRPKPGEQVKLPLPPAPSIPTPMKTPAPKVTPAVIAEHNARARDAVAAGDTTLLGWTAFYTFSGEVSETDFGLAWEAAGLPEKFAPGLGARGALSKALTSLESDFKPHYCRDDSKGSRCVYSLITKDKAATRHQLVTYDSADKSLTFDTPYREQDIRALFTKYNATLLSSDITEALRRVLSSVCAIPLKHGGGIWFVPVAQRATLEQLEQLAARVPGLSFVSIDMTDKVKHRTVVRESATDALKTDIAAAGKSLATLLEASKERDVRPETLARRLADYRRLREKALSYRELVEMDVSEVEKQLTELSSKVQAVIDGDDAKAENK